MDFFKKLVPVTKKTILIIDDEEDFCHFVKLNLEETKHFEVLTAYNGPDGIDLAIRYQPDLILLDIIMPNMTGTEVAESLRNNKATKDIPIIFLTAIVKRGEVGSTEYQFGGNFFIFKPVKLDELIHEIGAKIR
ncbi:MAG: response regulator [Syntrophales bacterium]|jgi:CheY-like chemotaxis protein|nr:response regulator [Syntrophales bacterium]HOG06784.1 response regulator [Syntrophales bacterium]HOS76949.1 response regulator [Syntrophales bacterium]